uniref:Uncharacterized protein n=1 Tax=Mycena chlorophos TaxID=658473 RepID=A0ABQ0LHH0_MYCCL|nr:predicted protein [Mycena chlorophos]
MRARSKERWTGHDHLFVPTFTHPSWNRRSRPWAWTTDDKEALAKDGSMGGLGQRRSSATAVLRQSAASGVCLCILLRSGTRPREWRLRRESQGDTRSSGRAQEGCSQPPSLPRPVACPDTSAVAEAAEDPSHTLKTLATPLERARQPRRGRRLPSSLLNPHTPGLQPFPLPSPLDETFFRSAAQAPALPCTRPVGPFASSRRVHLSDGHAQGSRRARRHLPHEHTYEQLTPTTPDTGRPHNPSLRRAPQLQARPGPRRYSIIRTGGSGSDHPEVANADGMGGLPSTSVRTCYLPACLRLSLHITPIPPTLPMAVGHSGHAIRSTPCILPVPGIHKLFESLEPRGSPGERVELLRRSCTLASCGSYAGTTILTPSIAHTPPSLPLLDGRYVFVLPKLVSRHPCHLSIFLSTPRVRLWVYGLETPIPPTPPMDASLRRNSLSISSSSSDGSAFALSARFALQTGEAGQILAWRVQRCYAWTTWRVRSSRVAVALLSAPLESLGRRHVAHPTQTGKIPIPRRPPPRRRFSSSTYTAVVVEVVVVCRRLADVAFAGV